MLFLTMPELFKTMILYFLFQLLPLTTNSTFLMIAHKMKPLILAPMSGKNQIFERTSQFSNLL
jgi:hypothetical protein